MTIHDSYTQDEEQRFREALAEIAAKDRHRQRVALTLIILAVLVAAAWLLFAVHQVHTLNERASTLRRESEYFQRENQKLQERSQKLLAKTADLVRTQEDLLNFLAEVTSRESIGLVAPEVDWVKTKAQILSMPAGTRKSVLLSAVLLAWKAIPFSMSNTSLRQGLDSPHFINYILQRYGVPVRTDSGQRLSDAMMSRFKRVDEPLPGDLIFYRGNVGNFVVMYIGPGRPGGKGVAVGTLQTGEELMVLDTAYINTPRYPFIGYFRIPYPESRSSSVSTMAPTDMR
jgi:cell wall-associated NlpC family hydrolase